MPNYKTKQSAIWYILRWNLNESSTKAQTTHLFFIWIYTLWIILFHLLGMYSVELNFHVCCIKKYKLHTYVRRTVHNGRRRWRDLSETSFHSVRSVLPTRLVTRVPCSHSSLLDGYALRYTKWWKPLSLQTKTKSFI